MNTISVRENSACEKILCDVTLPSPTDFWSFFKKFVRKYFFQGKWGSGGVVQNI